jgi:hypothetical protein
MAITTYSELKSAILDWMARSDFSTSQVEDTITLFEAVANRRLRVRQMEAEDTLTTTDGEDTLPTDYLTWRSLTYEADVAGELEYVDPKWLRASYPSTDSGTPQFFTIEGETLTVRPVDDTTDLTLRYYQKVPALSSGNDTNWLLTAHPDLYLFGSLVEANAFTQDEKALIWKARRDEIFQEIEMLHTKTRGPSAVKIFGTVI